ncbi:MAG: type II toxin-antitoxin system VapC family toxin [Thioploca sp.]|nr:type II toxin-antitoxin system VapC family toxin [Thioploca sp.]
MKPKVYLETSIPSYLSARHSRDLVMMANQEITQEWWDSRDQFELYISALALQEAGAGDPSVAQKRLEHLNDIPELNITKEVENFAEVLIQEVPLPEKARIDALHIAVTTLSGMDYLLTWNCAHIANAVLRPEIEVICRKFGYEPPIICTPPELIRYE